MIRAQWCQLIEGLQVPPLDFYRSVEAALDRRQIPGLKRSHVIWPEGGLLSARRDYLQLSREKLRFDICAAPFGTGFFVSSRLVDTEFPWFLLFSCIGLFLILMCFSLIAAAILFKGILGAAVAGVLIPALLVALICLCLIWWFGGKILRDLDKFCLDSPLLGAWYERVTRRNTYYRFDAVLCFQEAVHAAVMEVVHQYCQDQELKPLSEFEQRPVMSQLLMH